MGDDKTTYEQKMEARLRELDAEMELLRAKADRLEADAKARGRTVLDDLARKREEVANQLQEYRDTTGSALEELRHGLASAVEDFSDGVKRASRRFEER